MKKKVFLIIFFMVVLISAVSLYATFAYNEELDRMEDSTADYNLVYSLKSKSNQSINVASQEEKYVDITLENTYSSTIKYGMYYYLNDKNKLPSGVVIELASNSPSKLEDTIKARESKTITIRINNTSDYSIDLIVGALVGFENGDIADLVSEGEVLIK